MEEKKSYKIGLLPMILLFLDVILIITVIIMGMVIHHKNQIIAKNKGSAADVIDANNDFKENINSEPETELEPVSDTNTVANNVVNQNKENKTNTNTANSSNNNTSEGYTSKIVENRPYVYDAQYNVDTSKVNSYSTNDGTKYEVSDIVVPYVNMVSDDANKINLEIEQLYSKFIEEFKICSQNLNSYIKVGYQTYITSNIYSVLITVQRGFENSITTEYFAYNFDIISGTKLDYNQVCYIAGISDVGESVKKRVEVLEDYNSYYLVPSRNVTQEAADERKIEVDAYKSQVYTYYQEDLLNNKLVYFLDNNLKLNIGVRIILPDSNIINSKIIIIES